MRLSPVNSFSFFLSVFLLSGLLCSTPGLAQGVKEKDKEKDAPTAPIQNETPSAHARSLHEFGAGATIGSFIVPIVGGGFSFHYSLSSALQFEGAFLSGTWDASDAITDTTNVVLDKFDVNGSYGFAGVKYFMGNSFYLATGVGMRTIDFDLQLHSGSIMAAETIKTTSSVLRLALGNVWSWDSGFYIGGEWIGVAIPLTSSTSTSVTTSADLSGEIAAMEKDATKVADRLSKTTTTGLALLLIGFQF